MSQTEQERLLALALKLSCEDQHNLAMQIAANVGYELTPEPEHPDSPHCAAAQPGEPDERDVVDKARAWDAVAQAHQKHAHPAGAREAIARLSDRIATMLNEVYCEMLRNCDDSIAGFNEAWDVVRRTIEKENAAILSALPGPAPDAGVRVEPTSAQVNSACLSYRHDFGLLPVVFSNQLRFEAREWLRAWQKEGFALAQPATGERGE